MGSLTVIGAKRAKPGRHSDGEGLYLVVKPTGARSWVLRVVHNGNRRDIGLGAADLDPRTAEAERLAQEVPILHRRSLSLAEAREKSAILRRAAKAGRDPKVERDKDRKQIPTFKEAADACHVDLKAGWAPKNAAAFLSSLEDHAYSILGQFRVDHIEASHVRDALAPIWTIKPEMARKVRQRIGIVLNYAKAKGWRLAEAPGRSVTMGLARRVSSGNHAAMPYSDVPAFVTSLEAKAETVGRLALLFTILTAARSGEVRSARWDQIDRDKALWIRPASIMKGRVAHTVTLSTEAVAILDRAAALNPPAAHGLIFPSAKGSPLSDMTLSKIMRDAKQAYTVHGFRSSFRDFAAEQLPSIPDPVAEAALAHVVPDKVERAYKRTNFLAMRRKLLDAWSAYVGGAAGRE